MSEMSDPVAALQQADERDSWRAELAGAAPGSARAELVERALRASYESEHPSSEPADAAAERGDPLAIANALGVPAGTDPDPRRIPSLHSASASTTRRAAAGSTPGTTSTRNRPARI